MTVSPIDVYRIRYRPSVRREHVMRWLAARDLLRGPMLTIVRLWSHQWWRGPTYQAEWPGCSRAVRGWTRRQAERRAWRAMG